MDEAAINALVEQRVAEALAKREIDEVQQAGIKARQGELQQEQNRALRQQAQAAEGESAARLRAGSFGETERIARSIRNSPSVQEFTDEMYRVCYGD